MVSLSTKFYKECLPQMLRSPFLRTLSHTLLLLMINTLKAHWQASKLRLSSLEK